MTSKIKILWADDEIRTLFVTDPFAPQLFEKAGIEVVKTFTKASDLINELKTIAPNSIDAVVVDANFPYNEWAANAERDSMGLKMVAQYTEAYNYLPFVLFTGRQDIINGEDACLFQYFAKNDQIIYKGAEGIQNLIDKIKDCVQKYNSTEWEIKQMYASELKSASQLDDIYKELDDKSIKDYAPSYDRLVEGLVAIHDNKFIKPETILNSIRSCILEPILFCAKRYGIVPEVSLNDFSRLLCFGKLFKKVKNATTGIECKVLVAEYNNRVLPSALDYSLEFLVRSIQDGSHGAENSNKRIREYIEARHKRDGSLYVVRSIIFASLDIVVWFVNYLNNHMDEEQNRANWGIPDSEDDKNSSNQNIPNIEGDVQISGASDDGGSVDAEQTANEDESESVSAQVKIGENVDDKAVALVDATEIEPTVTEVEETMDDETISAQDAVVEDAAPSKKQSQKKPQNKHPKNIKLKGKKLKIK